jgi:hypothetical protein
MNVSTYITLIGSFIDGKIQAVEFESKYLKLFKEERQILSTQIYEILNKLFTDVDAFCSDPALQNRYSINESQLRECARQAWNALTALQPNVPDS